MADTETDEEHRKLESQQQFRVFPEKSSKLTDSTDMIFTLPNYIWVMVSNYQPLQTIFAIDKSECHTREIKQDEQFSPIVTIADTATRQTLDCVLLLHGEKPPEVNQRTSFCYIEVQVTVVPNHDEHVSYLHPPYHMKSKPHKQSKLPLIICFYQPGTVCVIQLSIHSIVDSEGVEYMYDADDCNCIVQVVGQEQRQCYTGTQHGVVRVKEPPLLRYTGPLATKQYHKLEDLFTKMFLCHHFKQLQQLSKEVTVQTTISTDIKVFAQCWVALTESVFKRYEQAETLLRAAWENASKLECENGLLLQGRVLKHMAFIHYSQDNGNKALKYISGAKERLFNAAPSNETAFALHTELLVKKLTLFSKCTYSSEQYESAERDYERLLEHANYMEDYEKPLVCNFLTVKASFHLRSALITDELPPKEYWPSPDDLRKAEECLSRVSLDTMPSQRNFYTARYYCTLCDLQVWKQQYPEAMHYLKKAIRVKIKLNKTMHNFDQRLKLLKD